MATSVISSELTVTREGLVPYVFGFFLASRAAITFLAFQSNPGTGAAAGIAGSMFFVFLAWVVNGTRSAPLRCAPLLWLYAYLALIAVSLFWSVTDSVMVAFAYWAGLVADCFAVYLLTGCEASGGVSEQLLTGYLTGAAFLGVIAWSLPTLADLRVGDEEFLHPNALGYTLAIATIVGMHVSRNSRIAGILTMFCGVTLLRTISKACIAGCLASIAFYLLRASHLSRRAKVAIYGLTAFTIVAGWSLVEAYIDMYDRASHIETLTGRTSIWSIAWEESLKKPWIGHGFYSFRFVIPTLGNFSPQQAHNELLQQFFCYGILGVMLLVLLYSSFCRFLFQHKTSEWVPVGATLMVFVIIRGIADTERFDVNFPLWLMMLLILTITGRQARTA